MSTYPKKTIKDLNLLDSFLFSVATENPENAKLIAKIVIRRVFGWQVADIQVETEKQYRGARIGDNRMIYTVKNMVVENPELVYNEGVTRVFLYTDGEIGGSEEIRSLLKYFEESNEQNAVDPELQAIQSVVSNIKNDEEVGEHYMTWDDVIQYEKRDSYEEGRKSGIYEGQVSGFISASREFGKSNEEIIQMLIDNFSLTKEEAINKVTPN